MNPRAATNDLLPFQGSPFNHLGTSAWLNLDSIFILTGSQKTCQRRGWDSNPRALADKRFSRPPRYDHFDTSPCAVSCFALTNQLVHNTKYWKICQGLFSTFFIFFSAFSKKRCFSAITRFLPLSGTIFRYSKLAAAFPCSQERLCHIQIFRRSNFNIGIIAAD